VELDAFGSCGDELGDIGSSSYTDVAVLPYGQRKSAVGAVFAIPILQVELPAAYFFSGAQMNYRLNYIDLGNSY